MVTGNCREWITGVYNQRNEGTCIAICFDQMVQGTLVMSGRAEPGLVLSPQGMIDIVGINKHARYIRSFCLEGGGEDHAEYGLEEECFNQFTNISRRIPFRRAREVFQTPQDERYMLRKIHYYHKPENVKAQICKLYEDNLRYPCVVIVKMYGFNAEVAGQVARGEYVDPVTGRVGALYRPTQAEKDDFEAKSRSLHALLVVGVNTDFEDEKDHYCDVKNSHGDRWGELGYSKIPFDFILSLFVPEP